MLCTFGFVADVVLSSNGPYVSVMLVQQPCCSVMHGPILLLHGIRCVLA